MASEGVPENVAVVFENEVGPNSKLVIASFRLVELVK